MATSADHAKLSAILVFQNLSAEVAHKHGEKEMENASTIDSKEIVWDPAVVRRSALLDWRGVKLKEGVLEMLVDLHHSRLVAASVAIIRCGEDCHGIPVMAPIVTLHHKLVRPRDELQAVHVVELLRDVLAKSVTCPTRRDAPTTSVIRV